MAAIIILQADEGIFRNWTKLDTMYISNFGKYCNIFYKIKQKV